MPGETPVTDLGVASHQAAMADVNAKIQYHMDKRNADWSNLPKYHELKKFGAELNSIFEQTGHREMYGVELQAPEKGEEGEEGPSPPHTTMVVLQKFLRANAGDVTKAKEQLISSLKWRKEYRPLEALDETFSKDKFGGLGYVTKIKGAKETKNEDDVVTFNLYGAAAKDFKKTFGDTDAFIRWRVALMELTLQQLDLNSATKIVPDYGKGPDPYQAIQVHDYLSVSFFRQPSEIKASSQKIISMFQQYYPETVSFKYFVNVPTLMQWMMGAMKMLMSKDSIQKMTWMTYGNQLNQYLGEDVPKEYGGRGSGLEESALTVKYDGESSQKNVQVSAESGDVDRAEAANGEGTKAPEVKEG